jgi:hypothetical protein
MLEVPVTEPAVGPDGEIVARPTGRWNFLTAARMARLAAEIEAAALEAATRPLESLSIAELEAIAGVWPGDATAAGE